LGSSLNFSAHGWWGKEKNLSAEKSVRPKVLGAKPKQAGKKEGGWVEGIFARLLPFPFRLGVLLKKCSNFVQKTPPSFTFSEIERCCLGALRLGMVFSRQNPSIFEGERKRPLGNAEVPVRSTEKTKFSKPIFFLSPLAKGTAIFSNCPKAI